VVQERENKSRQLQAIMGSGMLCYWRLLCNCGNGPGAFPDPASYWISTWLWDFALFIITWAGAVIIFNYGTTAVIAANIGAVALMLVRRAWQRICHAVECYQFLSHAARPGRVNGRCHIRLLLLV
jgi:hypothetical protein